MVVEGAAEVMGELGMGMAEVKIWVLEAEMWVIVVVEVEVQVVVTYLVAAWAVVARRRREGRRKIGCWRISRVLLGGLCARKVWWCAVGCGWSFFLCAHAGNVGLRSPGGCSMRWCMFDEDDDERIAQRRCLLDAL